MQYNDEERFLMIKRCLGSISKNFVGIKLGGLYHKGRNTFTLEYSGILYILLFLLLIYADHNLLLPVLNNEILKIQTTHKAQETVISPTIAQFKNDT